MKKSGRIKKEIKDSKKMYYLFDTSVCDDNRLIIKKRICGIYIAEENSQKINYIDYSKCIEKLVKDFKDILEDKEILKIRCKAKNRHLYA